MFSSKVSKRSLLRGVAATVVGAPIATLLGGSGFSKANAFPAGGQFADEQIEAQIQREKTWAFFRSFYDDKDSGNVAGFLSHFSRSGQDVYQDAVLNISFQGYDGIAKVFPGFINAASAKLGTGRFSKVFHVTGDMRYGAVAEYVDLKNTFYSTNGITIQTVFDLDNGFIVRDTDYWDSGELGTSDIIGPAVTDGVALPLGAVHPNGMRRSGPSPVPPGSIELARSATGHPTASAEMIEVVSQLHNALRSGSPRDIAELFTEDACYVNPLIHQGTVLYGNYDQTIQIRGRDLIVRLFGAALNRLPDCRSSQLIHVVGGPAGGGFEWKAGGIYANTGIDRTGLVGCTAIDLFGGRIQRMSVKFDTLQMGWEQYNGIKAALLEARVVDQPIRPL
jgi:hypothetical protein